MQDAYEHRPGMLSKKTPEPVNCSFSWSVKTILTRLGLDIPVYEIRGFSLNAFAIWAHPDKPVTLWLDSNCDVFNETLLRSLGLRGELLKIPDKESDFLDYFIHHWSGRVMENLVRGVPVACTETWTSSTWGIITEWNKDKRILKGYVPSSGKVIVNDSWPRKILLIGGSAVALNADTSIRLVLKQAVDLASNRIGKTGWVSGIDAYILWLQKIKEAYSSNVADHSSFSQSIAESRKDAGRFLTHHADFHDSETERMMLSLAKRYHMISENLEEAGSAPGIKPFVSALTEAMRSEEKALLLLEELIFRTE